MAVIDTWNANNFPLRARFIEKELVIEKYNELLELIDQGANFDRAHFETLKASVEKELEMIQSL